MSDEPDLIEALQAAIMRARQRRKDREPCQKCGGDRLRPDFTDPARCHARRTA